MRLSEPPTKKQPAAAVPSAPPEAQSTPAAAAPPPDSPPRSSAPHRSTLRLSALMPAMTHKQKPGYPPAGKKSGSSPAEAPTPHSDEKPAAATPARPPSKPPGEANVSHYSDLPDNIYNACRQFGITVPEDRSLAIQQAKACLITVFKTIMGPTPEKYMIWTMTKSIASNIEGFVAANTAVLNVLRRDRMNEDHLAWHCIYTAILAMGIARNETTKSSGSRQDIGGAALLHDIGLLTSAGGYNHLEEEMNPDCAGHVARSVELARRIEVPEPVITMIAQHHGRLDGKGYPKDLSPATFSLRSQALAIANMADLAVCNTTASQPAETIGGGLAKILKEYRQAYNSDLLKKMISLVGFYPTGSVVELNNRAICMVIKQNYNYPLRPMVQVIMDGTGLHPEKEELIDLKEVKILSILRTITSPAKEPNLEKT